MTTDPHRLCAVLTCGKPWAHDVKGWRTCTDHRPHTATTHQQNTYAETLTR